MQNSIFRMMLIILSGFFIFRYRYRLMNSILSYPAIRRVAVSSAMQMPLVRNRMMRQIL